MSGDTDRLAETVYVPVPGLNAYFKRDGRRTKCPDCGRDLITSTSGQRFCAYAENHRSGRPIFERAS